MSNASQITDLLAAAQDDGDIDPQTFAALGQLNIANSLVPTFGLPADDFKQNEVITVSLMPDDSGSIDFGGNTQNMHLGHNMLIDAFLGASASVQKNILWMCRTLNGKVIAPWCELSQAPRLPHKNYNPIHGTPFFDSGMEHLASVLVKFKEFESSGVPARTITCFVSDGFDEHSTRHRAEDIRRFAEGLTSREHHIIAGMGLQYALSDAAARDAARKDPNLIIEVDIKGVRTKVVNFEHVYRQMGIQDKWILTTSSDLKDIRAAFQTLSQTAVRASQSAASFSQQAAGGFGAP